MSSSLLSRSIASSSIALSTLLFHAQSHRERRFVEACGIIGVVGAPEENAPAIILEGKLFFHEAEWVIVWLI